MRPGTDVVTVVEPAVNRAGDVVAVQEEHRPAAYFKCFRVPMQHTIQVRTAADPLPVAANPQFRNVSAP